MSRPEIKRLIEMGLVKSTNQPGRPELRSRSHGARRPTEDVVLLVVIFAGDKITMASVLDVSPSPSSSLASSSVRPHLANGIVSKQVFAQTAHKLPSRVSNNSDYSAAAAAAAAPHCQMTLLG